MIKGVKNVLLILCLINLVSTKAQDSIYIDEFKIKGKLIKLSTMQDSLENGLSVTFYDSLKVSTISIKKEGAYIGQYMKYYSNGELMIEGNFSNTLIDTNMIYYECLTSSDGLYENVCNYESMIGCKEGQWSYYYSTGKLQKKGEFINGVKNGEWSHFNLKGEITKIEIWENGKFQMNKLIE
ncbi:MAG: hypothetical protein OQJ96_04355 [Flavobacteriales bacterium]|nr:hypothetical protein [Flavobacteriales bacterium]MCW8911997.1 hypothetical protein [Flavobacteriales bacterium]MCW8936637.1 hypothetical protein [Flavobacteriales bacterium]MCW8941396.1 hypothetical protein [Flavobacteriales bacterium]MCW8968699.1 hypothetical protein [Flavobacteriales bacterium]